LLYRTIAEILDRCSLSREALDVGMGWRDTSGYGEIREKNAPAMVGDDLAT